MVRCATASHPGKRHLVKDWFGYTVRQVRIGICQTRIRQRVEQQIAGDIAEKLRPSSALPKNSRSPKQGTQNPEAYELYLKGLVSGRVVPGGDSIEVSAVTLPAQNVSLAK